MKFRSFFFGNYFYGICSAALAVEASLQQGFFIQSVFFYAAVFCTTVWFYTLAYISDSKIIAQNDRAIWYHQNALWVTYSQRTLLGIFAVSSYFLLKELAHGLASISVVQWCMVVLFPLTGLLYYGVNYAPVHHFNLRRVGWLKPFLIGFIWAGVVNVYPFIYYDASTDAEVPVRLMNVLLFFKNFMFVTVLCIMFDIKDYASDANVQLKTFVVNNGLRKTIFYILLPLSAAGLGSFLIWGMINDFSVMKILLNTLPFLCMISVAYSMHKRKSILYYLVLIDGLMLVKAVCGSLAMLFF